MGVQQVAHQVDAPEAQAVVDRAPGLDPARPAFIRAQAPAPGDLGRALRRDEGRLQEGVERREGGRGAQSGVLGVGRGEQRGPVEPVGEAEALLGAQALEQGRACTQPGVAGVARVPQGAPSALTSLHHEMGVQEGLHHRHQAVQFDLPGAALDCEEFIERLLDGHRPIGGAEVGGQEGRQRGQ